MLRLQSISLSGIVNKFCVFAQGEKKYTDKEKKDYGLPQQFEKSDLLDILNIRYLVIGTLKQTYFVSGRSMCD